MTLRTRTSHAAAAAVGGPGRTRLSEGRTRLSDGRLRHRRGRARTHHPEPAAVRRRAEALLGAGSGPPRTPPPEPPPQSPPQPPPLQSPPPQSPPPGAVPGPGAGIASVADPPPGEIPSARGTALRLAVRERLPLWLQARCAVEPRTVAAVAVVLTAAVAFAAQQYWTARPQPVTAPPVVTPAAAPAAAPSPGPAVTTSGGSGPRIVVDVSGKVRDPGVRRLPAGSRVEDALAAAGGVRPGTDTTGLNRARVLVDGEQVVVGVPAAPPAPGPLPRGRAPRRCGR
ncbi:SLBB domain-containing protein, partial [Streptomyces sp. NPDC059456]|uniref:SLBB domain-containing protein n=1 Tax=Streptomyces sp. NPDC059456 TaxID=3346838 RepID=UPI0036CF7EBF